MADEPVTTADSDEDANQRAHEAVNENEERGAREPDERLLRALADLDNLRKRFAREVERERVAERNRSAALWLPVVDDLERALGHADATDANCEPLAAGVRAVYQQAIANLERLGFPRFDDVGEP